MDHQEHIQQSLGKEPHRHIFEPQEETRDTHHGSAPDQRPVLGLLDVGKAAHPWVIVRAPQIVAHHLEELTLVTRAWPDIPQESLAARRQEIEHMPETPSSTRNRNVGGGYIGTMVLVLCYPALIINRKQRTLKLAAQFHKLVEIQLN